MEGKIALNIVRHLESSVTTVTRGTVLASAADPKQKPQVHTFESIPEEFYVDMV